MCIVLFPLKVNPGAAFAWRPSPEAVAWSPEQPSQGSAAAARGSSAAAAHHSSAGGALPGATRGPPQAPRGGRRRLVADPWSPAHSPPPGAHEAPVAAVRDGDGSRANLQELTGQIDEANRQQGPQPVEQEAEAEAGAGQPQDGPQEEAHEHLEDILDDVRDMFSGPLARAVLEAPDLPQSAEEVAAQTAGEGEELEQMLQQVGIQQATLVTVLQESRAARAQSPRAAAASAVLSLPGEAATAVGDSREAIGDGDRAGGAAAPAQPSGGPGVWRHSPLPPELLAEQQRQDDARRRRAHDDDDDDDDEDEDELDEESRVQEAIGDITESLTAMRDPTGGQFVRRAEPLERRERNAAAREAGEQKRAGARQAALAAQRSAEAAREEIAAETAARVRDERSRSPEARLPRRPADDADDAAVRVVEAPLAQHNDGTGTSVHTQDAAEALQQEEAAFQAPEPGARTARPDPDRTQTRSRFDFVPIAARPEPIPLDRDQLPIPIRIPPESSSICFRVAFSGRSPT